MDWKCAMNSEVPLGGAEGPYCIPTEVTLPKGFAAHRRWIREGGTAERLTTGVLWAEKVERNSRDQVRSNLRDTVKKTEELPVKNVRGRSRPSLNNTLQRPSAQNSVRESVDL